jgi:hypothetical protein
MLVSSVDDADDVDDIIKIKNCQLYYTYNILTVIMAYFRNDARMYLISMYDLYYEYRIIKFLFILIWNDGQTYSKQGFYLSNSTQ